MTILLIKEWKNLVILIYQILQLGHKQVAVASKVKNHPQKSIDVFVKRNWINMWYCYITWSYTYLIATSWSWSLQNIMHPNFKLIMMKHLWSSGKFTLQYTLYLQTFLENTFACIQPVVPLNGSLVHLVANVITSSWSSLKPTKVNMQVFLA